MERLFAVQDPFVCLSTILRADSKARTYFIFMERLYGKGEDIASGRSRELFNHGLVLRLAGLDVFDDTQFVLVCQWVVLHV